MIEQLAMPLTVRRRKLSSQQERCLRIMRAAQRAGGRATNHDFIAASLPNFRSRLSELRHAHYGITEGEYIARGLYGYRLEWEARPVRAPENSMAMDPVIKAMTNAIAASYDAPFDRGVEGHDERDPMEVDTCL